VKKIPIRRWFCKNFGGGRFIYKLFGCHRFEKSVLLCSETGGVMRELCPDTEYRTFWSWEKLPLCPEHTNEKYEIREVCDVSGDLPNGAWCPITVERLFKRSEVSNVCSVHVPPEKPKFDKDLSWKSTHKFYSGVFNKGALFLRDDAVFNQPHYHERDFKQYINEAASENWFNVMRAFGWYNAGAAKNHEINMPHPLVNGLFDLHTISMRWWEQVERRIEYVAERGGLVSFNIDDQGTTRRWNDLWLHESNNHGWNGRKTYFDPYGWFKWVHYADGQPEDIKDFREGRIGEAEAWSIIWKYTATRDYLLYMYDWMLERLAPYKASLLMENNEVDAGVTWHDKKAAILDKWNYGRDQRMTSVRRGAEEWYHTKPGIVKRWHPQIHSVFTMEDYKEWNMIMGGIPFVSCGDGGGEDWWKAAGPEGVADILEQNIRDGNYGHIGNTEGKWDIMDWTVSKAMRDRFVTVLNI